MNTTSLRIASTALCLLGLALSSTAAAQSRAASESFSGTLDASDRADSEGRHVDSRTLNLRAGEEVELSASSSDFDTVLRVEGPAGFRQENDDDGEGTNSRLQFRAPATGAYRVSLSSYQVGEQGSYTLLLVRGGGSPVANNNVAPAPRTGCDSGACPMPQNPAVAQNPQVDGATRQWVFDPSTGRYVLGIPVSPPIPAGAPVPPAPTAMPVPGVPAMQPSAVQPMEPGMIVPLPPNSVAVAPNGNDGQENPDNTFPQEPVQPAPAGEGGTGTVYGVFVGVSDYGGSNDLQFTADDARNLSSAFERSGLIRRGNAVVLTDREATMANVAQAIQRLAPRVTARDTFVFFFDGHGNHNSIALRSGSMNERYLSNLLDGVQGRQLIVLDSCHSGSLSDIVENHPNRIGLFSSRASELSYVADEFQAGGYLAYAMISAVNGGANPGTDGILQLDELVDYVRSTYVQHVGNRQHLVVSAGAGQRAALWRNAGGTAIALR